MSASHHTLIELIEIDELALQILTERVSLRYLGEPVTYLLGTDHCTQVNICRATTSSLEFHGFFCLAAFLFCKFLIPNVK